MGKQWKQWQTLFFEVDQAWWVLGSVLGALAGKLLAFNTAGVDFAMTALFLHLFSMK